MRVAPPPTTTCVFAADLCVSRRETAGRNQGEHGSFLSVQSRPDYAQTKSYFETEAVGPVEQGTAN